MARNVIDIIVDGTDRVSQIFRRIGNTAERAFNRAERAFNQLENEMRHVPDVNIDVDTSKARAEISALQAKLERLERDDIEVKIRADTSLLLSSILALGPIISPLLATTSAAIVGLGTAFATAGIGALAFGAVAVPVLRRVFEETDNLTAKEREARKALEGFQSFWSRFTASFRTPILDMFIQSLGILQTALTGLKPVFSASITSVAGLLKQLDTAIKSSQVQTFFGWLAKNVGPSLQAFGAIFGNVLLGVMNLMMAFSPIATDMQNGLVSLTQRFAEWSAGLSRSKGFQQFIDYVQANGPLVLSVLGGLWDLMMNLLKAMAPLGTMMLKVLDSFLRFTNQLLATHPVLGQVVVAMLAVVGVFRLLSPLISRVSGFISRLVPYLSKAGTAVMNFAKQFRSLTTISIGGWVAVAVGFLLLLYNTSKRFADFVNNTFRGVWESLKTTFSNFSASLEPLKASLSTLGTTFSQLWAKLEPITVTIGVVLVGAIVAAIAVINGLLNALSPFIGVIIQVINAVVSLISAFVSLLTLDFSGFLSSMTGFFNSLVAISTGIVQTLVALFKGLWNTLVQVFAQFGINLNAVTVSIFTSLLSFITSIGSRISSFFTSLWNGMKTIASSAWTGIRSVITSAINAISSVVSLGLSRIRSIATSTWNTIRSTASSVWTSIRSIVMSAVNSIANTIRSGFNRAVSAVRSAGSSIRSVLSSLASSALSWGANLASMFARGISSRISAAVNAARNAAARIKSYLGFSSPTEKGPGKDADKWAPNLMSMFADGIKAGIPKLQIATTGATSSIEQRIATPTNGSSSAFAEPATNQPVINNYITVQGDGWNRSSIDDLAKQLYRYQERKSRFPK